MARNDSDPDWLTYRSNVDAFASIRAERFQFAPPIANGEPRHLDWRRRAAPRRGGNGDLNDLQRVKGPVVLWQIIEAKPFGGGSPWSAAVW